MASASDRFAAAMASVGARLPFGLAALVAPTLLGYLLINAVTFGLDLGLLSLLHGGLGWPLLVSITLSYATAFGLSFGLNRWLNFRSHRPVGGQFGRYVVVVVVNYALWIAGVGDGLTHLGLDYRVARVLAAVGEAGYMYSALRWVVFRAPRQQAVSSAVAGQ